MLITRTSKASGITRTQDIAITVEQLHLYLMGETIQNAMPHLTDDEREFIMTGITAEEWDEMFSVEDDETPPTIEEEIESYLHDCKRLGNDPDEAFIATIKAGE